MSERGKNGHFAPGNDVGVETRIKPGQTLNPGGLQKTRKELRMLARQGVPRAFERALQILDDDEAEWRAWIEAGKFLATYGIGNVTAGAKNEKDDDLDQPRRPLTDQQREALARMALSTEQDGDDGTGTPRLHS